MYTHTHKNTYILTHARTHAHKHTVCVRAAGGHFGLATYTPIPTHESGILAGFNFRTHGAWGPSKSSAPNFSS